MAVRVIAWAEAGQAPLLRAAARAGGLELVGVSSPDGAAATGLARELGVEPVATLRDAARRDDVEVIWLAGGAVPGPDERRLLRRHRRAVSCVPVPSSAAEALADPEEARTATFVPLMRFGPGVAAASEALASFGAVHAADALFACGGAAGGTLLARLYDCLDLLEHLLGHVHSIDAALHAPAGVPASAAGLAGHMTLNLRFADHRGACVAASDRAGGWSRRIDLLGDQGRLEVDDRGFRWTSADGRTLDEHRCRPLPTAETLVGRQVTAPLGAQGAGRPPDHARLLVLAETALLSCRTGQPEVPDRVLEMLRRT